MHRKMLQRVGCVALVCLGTLAACDVVINIRIGEFLNGCFVLDKEGEWGPGDLEYSGNFRCPIGIRNPGEQVVGTTEVIDGTRTYNGFVVDVFNSAGALKFSDQEPVREINGVRVFSMIVDYRAATGTNLIGDFDVLEMDVFRPGGVSYLDLELKTGQDNGLFSRIDGPDLPLGNTSQSWLASSQSGGRPHQFDWYRDGVWVGSGGKYTSSVGATDFELRVSTSDALGRTATNVMQVDVDGVRASISGPTMVYYSEGGGTWTASGRGGYEPYSFDWFVDGARVGSGASWSGYPGENYHTLRVDMRDSRGATHSTSIDVNGIGNDTCQPVPPQVTCQ